QAPSETSPATGRISGRVLQVDGTPIGGANVSVLGTRTGAVSDEEGRYQVRGVPVGDHEVRALALGYLSVVMSVAVNAGAVATVDFQLRENRNPVRVLPEFEVRGRPRDLGASDRTPKFNHEKLTQMPGIDNFIQMVALATGVVADANGALHIRGGREDEVKVRVSEIEMTNPLSGENLALANLAVSDVSLHTGTMEAE